MRLSAKIIAILFVTAIVSPAVLLQGCGGEEQQEGCPEVHTVYSQCANWANSTDSISGPESGELAAGAGYPGGTVYYAPLQYTVTDENLVPRNNVCVEFYTDGYFYQDRAYTTLAPSSGAGSRMILRTDDRGVICVYWSTEDLPPSPPSGSDDAVGDTWVNAYSGTLLQSYEINWTVAALP